MTYGLETLNTYIEELVDSDDPNNTADVFARKMLALVMLHKAKFGALELMRDVAGQFDGNGLMRGGSAQFRSSMANRMKATIQLAINHIITGDEMAPRMEREPVFSQLAVDALYYISRVWEDNDASVALGRDSLVLHLAQGIRGAKPASPGAAKAIIADVIGDLDLELILGRVAKLEAYLRDFTTLAKDLRLQWPPEDLEMLDVIPIGIADGLLREKRDDPAMADFTFDAFGRDVRPPQPPATRTVEEFQNGFDTLLKAAGVDREDLTHFGVLPNTIIWANVTAAAETLKNTGAPKVEIEDAALSIRAFNTVLNQRGAMVVAILALAQQITVDGQTPNTADPRPALAALDRYVGLAVTIQRDPTADSVPDWLVGYVPSRSRPSARGGLAARILRWTQFIESGWRVDRDQILPLTERAERAWTRWRALLLVWTPGSSEPTAPAAYYDDVVLAAAGLGPGSVMRRGVDLMTVADWSALALAAFGETQVDRRAPFWAGLAAMRALGFGGDLLRRLFDNPPGDLKPDPEAVEFASGRGVAGRGSLVLTTDTAGLAADTPKFDQSPVIAVSADRVSDYIVFLEWLYDHKAIEFATKERSDGV